MTRVASRVNAVEAYLQSLVESGLDDFGKGEWLAIVRAKERDVE